MTEMTMREAIIQEDFKFLDDIKIHNLDGVLMLGDEELPYNVGQVIPETEFVKEWLMGFALGNSLGINYFNTNRWLEMSNNGTRSVMIVNDADVTKPVLLIKPLISHNLTQEEVYVLRRLNERLHSLSGDVNSGSNPSASLGLAKGVIGVLDDVKKTTLTDMISPEFYAKHGINPAAEQKIYYVKDIINEGKRPIEDINKLRPLFYKLEEGKFVTREDEKFIDDITQGTFVFENRKTNDSSVESETKEQVKDDVEDDPFTC